MYSGLSNQHTFKSFGYFDKLNTNTRISICIFSLMFLGKLMSHRNPSFKNKAIQVNLYNIAEYKDEEKIDMIDKCVQTENREYDNLYKENIYLKQQIHDLEYSELKRLKTATSIFKRWFCTNLDEWYDSKGFILDNRDDFNYSLKHNNTITAFIRNRYQYLDDFDHVGVSHSIWNTTYNIKGADSFDISQPRHLRTNNISELRYYLYMVKLFQKYNPNIK